MTLTNDLKDILSLANSGWSVRSAVVRRIQKAVKVLESRIVELEKENVELKEAGNKK